MTAAIVDVLAPLPVRTLADLGCALRGGTLGRDAARMRKVDLVAYVADLASEDVIRATLANMGALPADPVPVPAEEPASQPASQPAQETESRTDMDTTSAPAPVPSTNGHAWSGTLAAVLERTIADIAGNAVNEDRVRSIVQEAIDKAVPATGRVAVTLDLSGVAALPPVDLEGKHPLLRLVLSLLLLPCDLRPNILLYGPTGSGKSTLAEQAAEALGAYFIGTSFSPDMSSGSIGSRILPIHDNGRFGSVDSAFLQGYEGRNVPAEYEGRTLTFFDELDVAPADVLVSANGFTGSRKGGHSENRVVDGRETWVPRSAHNYHLGAMNTTGTGANVQYPGRQAQDASVLDRYLLLHVGYDRSIEAAIMGVAHEEQAPWAPSASTDPEAVKADLVRLLDWYWSVQAKAPANRAVSPRMLQKLKALRLVGCSIAECKDRVLAGWTEDDLATIGHVSEPWGPAHTTAATAATADELEAFTEHPHDGTSTGLSCPRCNAPMARRTARYGTRAGKDFYGCTKFPDCRGTRPVGEA